MKIGVPKEIKTREYRVGLTPAGVRELCAAGHTVYVETDAAAGIGFTDEDYRRAGAEIAANARQVFADAELVVKVKEPQPAECAMLREGQALFAYLHLAPDPKQAKLLLKSRATAIAYETVTDAGGGLPLLAPMSEVAGRLAAQAGARALEKASGGRGVLMGGVPGVAPADVVVIGGGVVGTNAARMAVGMGASVTILDRSLKRLAELEELFAGRVTTLYSTEETLEQAVTHADLVIGAVLLPGKAAPKLVSREMISRMRSGAAVVDVAIDQGGCFATSKPTTHDEPMYIVDDVVHYCVANMPGAVARTATLALTNATLPYVLKLANNGLTTAMNDRHFLAGLTVHRGKITQQDVADALGYEYFPADTELGI